MRGSGGREPTGALSLLLFVVFVLLPLRTVSGELFVKYEALLGSPVSIPIETSPPTRLVDAPAWVSISDQGKEPNTDKHTPVVLLLQGTAQETGVWSFSIADQVGVVSVVIEVVEPKQTFLQGAKESPHQKTSTDNHQTVQGAVDDANEVLEPSQDHSLIKPKRRRRTVLEGSGHHTIGNGDDEDYNDEDEEDEEDYEDEDGDDLLEDRKVPIEPTPSLQLPPSSFIHEESTSTPVAVRIQPTPTATTQTPPSLTSPVLARPDYVEYGSGLEPETTTRRIEQPWTTTQTPSPPKFEKTHRNLEKLAIPSGKLFTHKIPDDLFTPVDGGVRYSVEPQPSGAEAYESWIWVTGSGWIHALPRDKDIHGYNLTLVAERVDSGERAEAALLVIVRQRPKWRMYNHEIEVEWGRNTLLDRGLSPGALTPVEEGVHLVRGILGGDWGNDDIIVRRLEAHGVRFKLFYTNETLLVGHSQNTCPVTELDAIARRLRHGLDSVSVHLTGSLCEGMRGPPAKPQEPAGGRTHNYPPSIRNPVDVVRGVKGEFLVRKVNPDFCYDPPEEGSSQQVHLSLSLGEGTEPLNDSNWLQFDEKNWEFYGLPGVGGTYTLVCRDSGGKPAYDVLRVEIADQPPSTEESYLTLNLHFLAADFKPGTIRKFISRLAAAFNDSDTSNIIVRKYQESSSGNQSNVHFTWVNRTNPADEREIVDLRRVMLSNDGPPRREFVEFFRPEFEIKVGELIPSRAMIGTGTINEDVKVAVAAEDDGFIKYEWMDSSQYLITFVIPGILIFIMVLLAVLIACLLSRHSTKTVATAQTTRLLATNNAMLKKGVPVIFQDEYFDETERQTLNESSSRSPAILRDEHPPLPPEYRRHNVPSVRSNMNIQGYQPPPGFNRAHGHVPNTRPHPQHGGFGGRGRNPPPYVPP